MSQCCSLSTTCNILYRPQRNEIGSLILPKESKEVSEQDVEKVVNVAVIGMPNAGKSTLINTMLSRRVLSVSKKCHTTRCKTIAVGMEGNTQIVFLDNPGFVTRQQMKRYGLEKSFYDHPFESVKSSDVVVLIHDAADFHYKYQIAENVERTLEFVTPETKTVLALNKVDRVINKRELLGIARKLVKTEPRSINKTKRLTQAYEQFTNTTTRPNLMQPNQSDASGGASDQATVERKSSFQQEDGSSGPKFEKIFMISALNGDGVTDLKDYILSCAMPSQWEYQEGYFTDQSLSELISMCAREKMLDHLSDEIPYRVKPEIENCLQTESGGIDVTIKLPCPRKRYASALMGPGGSTIRHLAKQTELALSEALQQNVTVRYVIHSPDRSKR